jgi:high frequency lysogenization protein
MDTLGNRIAGLQRQLEHFDLQSETLLSAMAGIYVDVISPLGPRIQVTGSCRAAKPAGAGESSRLPAGRHSRRRALASGGRRRLQLMFSRNRLVNQAKQILAHLTPEL